MYDELCAYLDLVCCEEYIQFTKNKHATPPSMPHLFIDNIISTLPAPSSHPPVVLQSPSSRPPVALQSPSSRPPVALQSPSSHPPVTPQPHSSHPRVTLQ